MEYTDLIQRGRKVREKKTTGYDYRDDIRDTKTEKIIESGSDK